MTEPLPTPLSVLDLAPVPAGGDHGSALRQSVELAGHAERLGYRRFWVAEHHNMPGIASSSPAVLLAHAAAATTTIRIGSGGVMLPNHAPLVVAEQFGTLEALHPGRVDLGIGRAPGTDPVTTRALRRSADPLSVDDFPQQLAELVDYFRADPAEPARRVTAVPGAGDAPDIWLLGSSGYSAQLAGMLGLPFAFAHHFMAANTEPAVELYRRSFRPSARLAAPYVLLGVAVFCAETDERARWLAGPSGLSFLRLRTGRPGRLPSPEEAAAHPYDDAQRAFVADRLAGQAVGAPATVRAQLEGLLARTGADELMATTIMYDHADRLRSFELLAEACGLSARSAPARV